MSGTHIRAMIHCSLLAGYLAGFPLVGWAQEAGEQKSIRMTCGTCPDGYSEVGSSSVPSRCGSKDGGRLSQCQLQKMEQNLPDPTQGVKTCPPDCGTVGRPGQGALPPLPRFQQAPDSK